MILPSEKTLFTISNSKIAPQEHRALFYSVRNLYTAQYTVGQSLIILILPQATVIWK